MSDQPPLLQQLANLQGHYTRLLVSLPNEPLYLTCHQNTSNHFISHKKLPSLKCLPCTNLRPGQRTVAQKQSWRKSETWSQICCMTKFVLNNNWIHAEMKAVILNKKYLPYSFSSFFKATIYSCYTQVCRQSNKNKMTKPIENTCLHLWNDASKSTRMLNQIQIT